MFDKWKDCMQDAKRQKLLLLFVVVALTGICLTFMPTGSKKAATNVVQAVTGGTTSEDDVSYEQKLEKRLKAILEKMNGVGGVSVMITTSSNEEKILAEDVTQNSSHSEEQDSSGGTRNSVTSNTNNQIVLQSGNTPYVIKENNPEIIGVLILAEGAEDSVIKSEITDAVSRLLNVPVHKISVLKKQK